MKPCVKPIAKRVIEEFCSILKHPHCPEDIKIGAARALESLVPRHPQAMAELVRAIATTKNDSILQKAVDTLENIAPEHPQLIPALIPTLISVLIDNEKANYTRIDAAKRLNKMGLVSSQLISYLLKFIEIIEDQHTRLNAIEIVLVIDPGNCQAINELIKIIGATNASY